MKALDLFCGAGGASMGLHQAGFEVVGIDIELHPDYPFEFIQGDAMHPPANLQEFDLIWASPPCQAFSNACQHLRRRGKIYPNLIPDTRALLDNSAKPYVIENVPSAPIRKDLYLTGGMFNRSIERRRFFEISGFRVEQPVYRKYQEPLCTVAGNGRKAGTDSMKSWNAAMGINWMKKKDLTQAVPPAYSRYIGEAFRRFINVA